MSKLLLASRNPGKIREFRDLLREVPLELLMPGDLGLALDIHEGGSTYAENASKKAREYANASGLVCMGDDSGLEVAALGGAPGLFSARYLPQPGSTDADRRAYLLDNLQDCPRPWLARFRCCVAIASPRGDLDLTEGTCPGEIIPEERGTNGFGYDPIFLLSEIDKTMAELTMAEKNQLSHRALAVRAAIPLLLTLL